MTQDMPSSQQFAVPSELTHYMQWVCWRLVQKPGKSKPDKVPLASTTDSTTWTDYETARNAALNDPSIDGVGFVFTASDPFCFVDIDGCGTPGQWNATAQAIAAALPGATWETSQSGNGLHGIAKIYDLDVKDRRNKWTAPDGTRCEFYAQERFIALGRCDWSLPVDAPLGDVRAAIGAVVPQREYVTDGAPMTEGPRADYNGPSDDAELIKKASEARGSAGAQFGERATFLQLWEGDSRLAGFYPDEDGNGFDHSSADAALMDHLAFWTGCDQARMERLFSQSALGQRDKWKERGDYRASTIHHATRDPNRRYMKHERPDPATVATPGGGVTVAPSGAGADVLAQYVTALPDKNDHRYMIAMMIEAGFDVHRCDFNRAVTVNGDKISDALEIDMWFACNERSGLNFPKAKFQDAIQHYAGLRPVHPVRQYLDECAASWDGTPRLDTWLIDHAGAVDTPYVRAVSAATLIALARRVRQPGCKHDEMLILEGVQGAGKSTIFENLCPDPEWFTDAVNVGMDTKQVMEVTQGKWIVEAPELSKMSGAEVEHVKAMLSRKVDSARLAYGRHAQDWPRQFIMVGTVNGDQYLIDETGNRRFWPVRVANEIDTDGVNATRDQLWAEAAVRESRGEANGLPRDVWQEAQAEQTARMLVNPYQSALVGKLGTLTGVIALGDIFDALEIRMRERRAAQRPVTAAMKSLGWSYAATVQEFTKGDPARRIRALGGTLSAEAPRVGAVQ